MPNLELEYLVDSGVMTPEEALIAATVNGARALNREEDYGTIEPGKLAGMVILQERPPPTGREAHRTAPGFAAPLAHLSGGGPAQAKGRTSGRGSRLPLG